MNLRRSAAAMWQPIDFIAAAVFLRRLRRLCGKSLIFLVRRSCGGCARWSPLYPLTTASPFKGLCGGTKSEAKHDCLRIITRAEIRIANEVDAAQARGEVATPGQRSNVRASDISDFEELGLSRQRVAEYRELRDAGEDVVEGAIATAIDEGRTP